MVPGWPERVPGWVMMPMGVAGQPTSDLDLRFPMFLAHLSILTDVFQCVLGPRTPSLHACAAKSPKAELSMTPGWWRFGGFCAQGGNL